MEKDSVLEMRHIYKTFPGVKALQNVDFTLKKGEEVEKIQYVDEAYFDTSMDLEEILKTRAY